MINTLSMLSDPADDPKGSGFPDLPELIAISDSSSSSSDDDSDSSYKDELPQGDDLFTTPKTRKRANNKIQGA